MRWEVSEVSEAVPGARGRGSATQAMRQRRSECCNQKKERREGGRKEGRKEGKEEREEPLSPSSEDFPKGGL